MRTRFGFGFRLGALVVLPFALTSMSYAAGGSCTTESALATPGAWKHGWDQWGGASEIRAGQAEVDAAFARLDPVVQLVRDADPTPVGVSLEWHKVFNAADDRARLSPKLASLDVDVWLVTHLCAGGKVVTSGVPGDLEITVRSNAVGNVAHPAHVKIDGKEVLYLSHAAGKHRGHDAYERPLTLGLGVTGGTASLSRLVLIARPGTPPLFIPVTRSQVLAHLKTELQQTRAASVKNAPSVVPMRPAAEQEAALRKRIAEIENAAYLGKDAKARRIARLKADYQSDEQQRAGAVARAGDMYDAALARIAELERSHTAAELEQQAILEPGQLHPNSALGASAKNWGFREPKTGDHICTPGCRHGQPLVTLNPAYVDAQLPRTAPQSFVVETHWRVGMDRERDAFVRSVADGFLEKFDYAKLAAMLGR